MSCTQQRVGGLRKLSKLVVLRFLSFHIGKPHFQGLVVGGISKLRPVADPSRRSLVVLRPDDGGCLYFFITFASFSGQLAPRGSGSSKAEVTWDNTLVGDTRRRGPWVPKIEFLILRATLRTTIREIMRMRGEETLSDMLELILMRH